MIAHKTIKRQTSKAITIFPNLIQRIIQKHKLLQTQIPTFEGQNEKHRQLEHLEKRVRPLQHKIQYKENTGPLKGDAIENWQTTWVTSDIELKNFLVGLREKVRQERSV